MKTITYYLLVTVVLFALQGCSNDDASMPVYLEKLSGEWCLVNIEGWKYDDDSLSRKTEFNKKFHYDGSGDPIGDDTSDAQRLEVYNIHFLPSEPGVYYIAKVCCYRWYPLSKRWDYFRRQHVRIKGNRLIDEKTNDVLIIKLLTKDFMITYQEDENGETYRTYTKL